MGALHDGHLSLVKRSLAENDLTVLSIFVNPAQFAPHEDLATYPRTLPRDIELLCQQAYTPPSEPSGRTRQPSAIFLPTVQEMYPSGITQTVTEQKGTFVEVKGYSEQMEGKSRPTFFRGVATVVTKLFNAVEPTHAYFGQKDIQQAILLRRLATDLLLSHPTPKNVHIVPTARDPSSGLALSSRNVYLSEDGKQVAPSLFDALTIAQEAWDKGVDKAGCIERAVNLIEQRKRDAQEKGMNVDIKLDYIEMNDAREFEVLDVEDTINTRRGRPVILSGALYMDSTRLIDNLILGNAREIVY
ncbi:pantoate-beta-alanine ligase [Marasmius crinis-equi]|uniref:Pantoate--beta-alanine ligase n=1 Tax=Marasmius crinis-equi TaxID=585013 RepID=A0ABR3FYJ5_9AGAR